MLASKHLPKEIPNLKQFLICPIVQVVKKRYPGHLILVKDWGKHTQTHLAHTSKLKLKSNTDTIYQQTIIRIVRNKPNMHIDGFCSDFKPKPFPQISPPPNSKAMVRRSSWAVENNDSRGFEAKSPQGFFGAWKTHVILMAETDSFFQFSWWIVDSGAFFFWMVWV